MQQKITIINKNLPNYLDYFLEMMEAERGASSNTVNSYSNDISDFIKFLNINNILIANLTQNNLLKFIHSLAVRDLKPRSIRRKISAIRQFIDFLISENLMQSNPTLNLPMPKNDNLLPKSLSEDSIKLLLEYAKKDSTKEGLRTYAMLELLYSTGMRISELISLKCNTTENIDLSKMNYLLIKGKGSKERIVIMNQCSCLALEKYLKIRKSFIKNNKQSIWLFPSVAKDGTIQHISRQRFGQILKFIASAVNIDPELVSPHKIRHSFATHLLKNGANIRMLQELLGHADITSTQIYTKVSNETTEKLILHSHPLNKL